MKKVLTLVCAIAASMLYSASVSWNSGTINDGFKSPTDSKISADMGFSVDVLFYSDSLLQNLISKSTATTPNGMTGSFGATPAETFTPLSTYYVKAIIQNDSYIRSTDVLSFTMTEKSDATLNFMTGSGLTNPSGGSNTWGDWTEKGGDVPEPTTCSLLLVGLAGMGLKKLRKRNKQA